MARTISEIYNAIILEKQTLSSLDGLTPNNDNYSNLLSNIDSDSKVAFWRLFCYIHAVTIHIHELLFDKFKIEISDIVSKAPTGTPAWYQDQVYNWQYGDLLTYSATLLKYVYSVIDTAKRIVTRCAVQDSPQGVVLIKVAKGVTGSLSPLSQSEKDALVSYLNKIKFAGTRISVSTQESDKLKVMYKIFYDPLIDLDTIKNSIQTAIESYLNNNLPFNAKLVLTKLTDVIQSVPGVVDPILESVINTPFAGGSEIVDREILPASGWFSLSDPIATTMIFMPVS